MLKLIIAILVNWYIYIRYITLRKRDESQRAKTVHVNDSSYTYDKIWVIRQLKSQLSVQFWGLETHLFYQCNKDSELNGPNIYVNLLGLQWKGLKMSFCWYTIFHTRRKIVHAEKSISEFCQIYPKLDCNCPFPIVLALGRISSGVKSIGIV